MSELKLQLNPSSILSVPLQTYNDDFTFIINGQEFKTSRLVSDLLSPSICRIHINDPTFDRFHIDTKQRGDFSLILQLLTFSELSIPSNETDFIIEVIEKLGNDSLQISGLYDKEELTIDNVFTKIKKHEKFRQIFHKQIEKEIDFISMHFYEMNETQKEEMKKLNENTLFEIISNKNLKINDEDQLLHFVNELYQNDTKFKFLYENVIFLNATSNAIKEFLSIFDYGDINHEIWSSISDRLESKVESNKETKTERYKRKMKNESSKKEQQKSITTFVHQKGHEFSGIIASLTKIGGGNPHDKGLIEVTTNYYNSNSSYHPKNLLDFNNDNEFITYDSNRDAWVCFDFKNREIEISNYTIKSSTIRDSNVGQIKNWVIEISSDGNDWTQIDQRLNNSELNGQGNFRTFDVSSNHFSRYCRFRHTGDYWGYPNWCLIINSIEFYGRVRGA